MAYPDKLGREQPDVPAGAFNNLNRQLDAELNALRDCAARFSATAERLFGPRPPTPEPGKINAVPAGAIQQTEALLHDMGVVRTRLDELSIQFLEL